VVFSSDVEVAWCFMLVESCGGKRLAVTWVMQIDTFIHWVFLQAEGLNNKGVEIVDFTSPRLVVDED
jgi:hypothetical protein